MEEHGIAGEEGCLDTAGEDVRQGGEGEADLVGTDDRVHIGLDQPLDEGVDISAFEDTSVETGELPRDLRRLQ